MASPHPSPASPGREKNTAPSPASLPTLRSIAPAIFIPITEDLTAPLPAVPSATTARLQAAIERHVNHSKAVQSNITNYHRREAYRRSLLLDHPTSSSSSSVSSAELASSNTGEGQGLSDKDRASLVRCLEKPHDPRQDWKLNSDHIPWPNRDKLQHQELRQLGQATSDLEGYRKHSNAKYDRLRAEWRMAKDREAA